MAVVLWLPDITRCVHYTVRCRHNAASFLKKSSSPTAHPRGHVCLSVATLKVFVLIMSCSCYDRRPTSVSNITEPQKVRPRHSPKRAYLKVWDYNAVIYCFPWNAIIHLNPQFNGFVGLHKSPLKLGHEWVITLSWFTWIWLLIHDYERSSVTQGASLQSTFINIIFLGLILIKHVYIVPTPIPVSNAYIQANIFNS